MRRLRLYPDTSVFGGCFDDEFAEVDIMVSWNFKHIVHFEKIRGYQGVNLVRGYHTIPIHTPREVIES